MWEKVQIVYCLSTPGVSLFTHDVVFLFELIYFYCEQLCRAKAVAARRHQLKCMAQVATTKRSTEKCSAPTTRTKANLTAEMTA